MTSQDLKIFNIDGHLVEKVGKNLDDYPMKSPRGVAINSKGEIVVSDSSRKCVYVYPIEGAFCEIIWGEVSSVSTSIYILILWSALGEVSRPIGNLAKKLCPKIAFQNSAVQHIAKF
mgnify:CR=1 FL=1